LIDDVLRMTSAYLGLALLVVVYI